MKLELVDGRTGQVLKSNPRAFKTIATAFKALQGLDWEEGDLDEPAWHIQARLSDGDQVVAWWAFMPTVTSVFVVGPWGPSTPGHVKSREMLWVKIDADTAERLAKFELLPDRTP